MIAYLGIGTNIGDRLENLHNAVDSLNLIPMTLVMDVSNIYETDPVGYSDQQDFLNMAVKIDTELSAESLLGVCLGIEAGMGRVRKIKNGPRIIDIDLLLYEDEKINSNTLTLPHPRMFERGFVIKPMLDLDICNPFWNKVNILKNVSFDGVRFYKEFNK